MIRTIPPGAPPVPVVGEGEVDQLEFLLPLLEAHGRAAAAHHPQRGEIGAILQRFLDGYRDFARTGITPDDAYVAMRQLSFITDGRFNQLMQDFYAAAHPPRELPAARGLLGDERAVRAIAAEVETHGVFVLPDLLPRELCDRLRHHALSVPCLPQSPPAPSLAPVLYDRARPLSVKYDVPEPVLVAQPDVQRLIADPSLLALAQAILGCQPIVTLIAMWWSTALLGRPDSYAAQLYHFDMDQSHFFKLFVYLTDVTPETGPHCFVRGSHRAKPLPLRRDGRIADEEIARHYRTEDIVEITGPAGTVFVANTRGLHKGKYVRTGDRLLFQLVFSASLFGAPYEPVPVPDGLEHTLAARRAAHPRTYARFVARA